MPMTHGDIILHNSLNGICSYCLTVDGLTNQTSCRGKVIASEGMGMGMGMEAVFPLFQVRKCNVLVKLSLQNSCIKYNSSVNYYVSQRLTRRVIQ